ncbi:Transcription factor, MADS-box [Artemisia annua]|uniref:Transcription factor, MADS-box n=1 Tax=Artemisia annua TaxID=35608 RepID=A0A2U1QC22_ARTAN|nr:Transcription factor, MADS-box [Artemisia annua]
MNVSGVSTTNKKTSKGRRKIPIEKIEETSSRQVTFSKRRNGLFKKASELCILTGAQMAILVQSPGGRCYAFGHPSPDAVIDLYMNNNNTDDDNENSINASTSQKQPPLTELNHHYNEVSKELEMEKKRNELIQQEKRGNSSELPWYMQDTEGMEVEEHEQFLAALMELKRKVLVCANDLANARITTALSLGTSYCYENNNTISNMNIVLDNFAVGNNLENTTMMDPMGLEGLGSDLDNF